MQRTSEAANEYRGKGWGVKYLMRGPNVDWGVILLHPGQELGEHGHRQVEELFFFLSGRATMLVNGQAHEATAGDAFRLEPQERHNIRNDGPVDVKVVFIKTPYLPDDKI